MDKATPGHPFTPSLWGKVSIVYVPILVGRTKATTVSASFKPPFHILGILEFT